ncbi:MAG: energy transducer TonB [Mucilaginibacter sp.]
MNKITLVIPLILLFFCSKANAQLLIEINTHGYFINQKQIESGTDKSQYEAALGKSKWVFKGINDIYIYDKLGLQLYQPPGETLVTSMHADIRPGKYKFSSKQTFKGDLVINGYKLSAGFNKDSLAKMPGLFFYVNSYPDLIQAITFNDVKIAFIFDEHSEIKSVGISFSADTGEFSRRAKNTLASETIQNIDFVYERGAINSNKIRIGTWEYYDDIGKLSLKYDHDNKSIIYQEKNNELFAIKNGTNWDYSEPDIYPHVIGSYHEFITKISNVVGYPLEARGNHISGTVYISFVVSKEGKLSDIKKVNDIGGNCADAIINALKQSEFLWIPASKGSISYDSRFVIPVTFILDDEIVTNVVQLDLPEGHMYPELKIIALGSPRPRE